jgi:CubicO group peptidase (beta-lactamase class C family)
MEIRIALLEETLNYAAQCRSKALLVNYRGETVVERYWKGWDPRSSSRLSSLTKSIVSVLVGICLHQGSIRSIDQPAADFISEWRGSPKEGILIRHLLSMTSGLCNPPLWVLLLDNSLDLTCDLDLVQPPGTYWEYNTGAYRILLTIIERATGQLVGDFSQLALFDPLGMHLSNWRPRHSGAKGYALSMASSAGDLLTFGRLLLQRGAWAGKRLLDADYVDAALRPSQALNKSYGFLFWLNAGNSLLSPGAPDDTAIAMGASDSRLYVIPSRELVMVRLGGWAQSPRDRSWRNPVRRGTFDDVLLRGVFGALREAEAEGEPEIEATPA